MLEEETIKAAAFGIIHSEGTCSWCDHLRRQIVENGGVLIEETDTYVDWSAPPPEPEGLR